MSHRTAGKNCSSTTRQFDIGLVSAKEAAAIPGTPTFPRRSRRINPKGARFNSLGRQPQIAFKEFRLVKLILMPGMDGTGELFAPLLRTLGNSIESSVLRYPTDEPLGYSELLARVRLELPKSGSFVLLGESFSGPLALMAAAEAPAGLKGVILCATFATNPIPWFPRFALPLVRPFLFRGKPRFAQIKVLLGRYETPELRALLFKANSAVSPSVMATRGRAILAVNVLAEYKACQYPLLYLRGEHDRVVRQPVVQSLLRKRPSLQVVTLPAPHLVLQVAPEQSARAIHAFLAATRAAANPESSA